MLGSCPATCSSVSVPQRSSSGMKVAAPPSATPAERSTAAEMASVTGLPCTPCAHAARLGPQGVKV